MFLVLLDVTSNELNSNSTDNTCISKSSGNNDDCNNCDSRYINEIVCDNEAQISTILMVTVWLMMVRAHLHNIMLA